MVNKNNKFDFDADIDDNNFKSCFARSMVVNSQHKLTKTTDEQQLQPNVYLCGNEGSSDVDKTSSRSFTIDSPNIARLRKDSHSFVEENRRFSCHSATKSRRGSISYNRPVPDIPIENIAFQSQIDTLQWQLKQTEASREMFRAVMKQVVSFLERAHRSLELLGTRIHTNQQPVHRSRSEYQMSSTIDSSLDGEIRQQSTDNSFEDSLWKRSKKIPTIPEEIPPEKLSQEAYRLLRTTQSLLNTREPDLAHISNDPKDDLDFISQLAKEFPQERKPDHITSFSLSPKLLTPDKETKISTALNRKLSLQINNSFRPIASNRESLPSHKSDTFTSLDNSFMLSSTLVDDKPNISSIPIKIVKKDCDQFKYVPEKSNSPPVSSVSSAEDESGFSSMNSFQEIGLPIISSTVRENTLSRGALLRSMLHSDFSHNFNSLQDYNIGLGENCANVKCRNSIDDYKLWQKPDSVSHKRSSSTPVDALASDKITMKVLWV